MEDGTNFLVLHPEPRDIRKYQEVAQQLQDLARLNGQEKIYLNFAKRRLVFGLN